MLADPQSVTLGSAISMPRITLDNMSGTFVAGDGSADLGVTHYQPKGRKRSVVRVRRYKVSTNPLTDIKSQEFAGITVTIDRPSAAAFTESELIELITGVSTWLTTTANANAKKVLGLES